MQLVTVGLSVHALVAAAVVLRFRVWPPPRAKLLLSLRCVICRSGCGFLLRACSMIAVSLWPLPVCTIRSPTHLQATCVSLRLQLSAFNGRASAPRFRTRGPDGPTAMAQQEPPSDQPADVQSVPAELMDAVSRARPPCTKFASTGRCKKGTKCRLLHVSKAVIMSCVCLSRLVSCGLSPLAEAFLARGPANCACPTPRGPAICGYAAASW